MSFENTSLPNAEIIVTPIDIDSLAEITIPPRELFSAELSFWNEQRDQASMARNEVAAKGATAFAQLLGNVDAKYTEVHAMAVEQTRAPNRAQIVRWHNVGSTAIALSRLWQELRDISPVPGSPRPAPAYLDFSANQPDKSAIHFRNELVQTELKLPPFVFDEVRWLKGKSVYVCAANPAVHTATYGQQHYELYGEEFFSIDFVSLMPSLKRSVWEGH